MKKILLLQLDGSLPNLALMRLASFHRGSGDHVELRKTPTVQSIQRQLWDDFDLVYAGLIFERTRVLADKLKFVYPGVILGGTGWDYKTTVEQFGVSETCKPDYSDYPLWEHSIGFTQRGCRLKCEFCVVPKKEGSVKESATIWDIWRGDPYPRNILLLDNDFFGQPLWRHRINEIREGGFRVSFNQGINSRMISEEAAEAIASVDYRDDGFKAKRLYTAWDNKDDEEVLFRGLKRLVKAGVKPDNIMVYVLIGFWKGETEDDWIYRIDRIQNFGCRPYPMPFVRNWLTRGFQRWVVRRASRKISWKEYKQVECRPERISGRIELPLFPDDNIRE